MSNLFGRECKAALTPSSLPEGEGQHLQSRKRGEATKIKGAGQAPFYEVMQTGNLGENPQTVDPKSNLIDWSRPSSLPQTPSDE